MKKLLTVWFSVISLTALAQVPSLINYQGIVRDSSNTPVVNRAFNLKFEILQGSTTGSVVFTEEQVSQNSTNLLGLFNTQIGKNTSLSTVNWQAGPYFLRVSLDINGGQNYAPLGTQQLVSVPFAMATPPPLLSYTSNILTVDGATVEIIQPTGVTVRGGSNVTVSGGPDFTVVATPTLDITGNALSISGGNSVTIPSPTITGTGLAVVTPTTGNNFIVDVPSPSYNAFTGSLTMGTLNTFLTPTLQINNGVLWSGPASNSVQLSPLVTVVGGGIVSVNGAPNYTVSAQAQTLTLNTNILSISNGNSVSFPLSFPQATVTGSGIAGHSSSGTNTFNINVPLPTYNGLTGVLSFGTQNTNVVPTLSLNSGTLSVGPASNSVSITGAFPWTKSTNGVTLTTGADRVGIGQNAAVPSAKLDVQGDPALTVPVIKANNTNVASTAAALDVASSGNLGLSVTNTNPGGVGGIFTSSQGTALSANNNSSFYTFVATNSNVLSTSYAGYFDGGIVSKGKGGSTNIALSARNATADVFVVRNDGNVGIGTSSPSQKLDVEGSVKITDGTEGVGKILMSDAFGNASWQPLTLVTTAAFNNKTLPSVGPTPVSFATPLISFSKVHSDTKVQVIVQTHVMVDDLNGVNSIMFEVRLGSTAPVASTGRVNYFKDNGGTPSTADFMPVTIIAEFAAGLPGSTSYNVNIFAVGLGGAGSGTNVYLDPGNFNASSVIIKEYR